MSKEFPTRTLDTAAWMLLDDAGKVSNLEDIQRAL
jgi:hypothetical protein